jgi:hypothetical protein
MYRVREVSGVGRLLCLYMRERERESEREREQILYGLNAVAKWPPGLL